MRALNDLKTVQKMYVHDGNYSIIDGGIPGGKRGADQYDAFGWLLSCDIELVGKSMMMISFGCCSQLIPL